MKIGLLIIATGNYTIFFDQLYTSAKTYFFKDQIPSFFLFTDQDYPSTTDITVCPITHEPWPMITLKRYHYFSRYKEQLSQMDYLFYSDADMKFVAPVGQEILPTSKEKFTVVQHPGTIDPRPKWSISLLEKLTLTQKWKFKKPQGDFETNPNSTAGLTPKPDQAYYAGGFNGGIATDFLSLSQTLKTNIDIDLKNNIIAKWHDESHLNKFFTTTPAKILSPSYCHPESKKTPYPPKLIALDKAHEKLRM